jgi:hypothetical protein
MTDIKIGSDSSSDLPPPGKIGEEEGPHTPQEVSQASPEQSQVKQVKSPEKNPTLLPPSLDKKVDAEHPLLDPPKPEPKESQEPSKSPTPGSQEPSTIQQEPFVDLELPAEMKEFKGGEDDLQLPKKIEDEEEANDSPVLPTFDKKDEPFEPKIGQESDDQTNETPNQSYEKVFNSILKSKVQEAGLKEDVVMELKAEHFLPKSTKCLSSPELTTLLKETEQQAQEQVKSTFRLPSEWKPAKDSSPFLNELRTFYEEAFPKVLEKLSSKLSQEEIQQLKFFNPEMKFHYSERIKELFEQITKEAWETLVDQHNLPGHFKHNQKLAEQVIAKEISTNKQVFDAIVNGTYVEFIKEGLSEFIQNRKPPLERVKIDQLKKALTKSESKEEIPEEIKEFASSIQNTALTKLRGKYQLPPDWTPAPVRSFSQMNPIAGSGMRHLNDTVRIVKDYVNQGLLIGDPGLDSTGLGSTSALTAENLIGLFEETLPVIEEAISRTDQNSPIKDLPQANACMVKVNHCLKEIQALQNKQLAPQAQQFLNAFAPTLNALKLMLDAMNRGQPLLLANTMTEFIDTHAEKNQTIFESSFKAADTLIKREFPQLPEDRILLIQSILTLVTLSFASPAPLVSVEMTIDRLSEMSIMDEILAKDVANIKDEQKLKAAIISVLRTFMLAAVVTLGGQSAAQRNLVSQALRDLADRASGGGNEKINQLLSELLEIRGQAFNPSDILDTLTTPLLETAMKEIRDSMNNPTLIPDDSIEKLRRTLEGLLKSLAKPSQWSNSLHSSISSTSLSAQSYHTA